MASNVSSTSVIKAKFRGCLIGVLVGDCLGAFFEIEGNVLPSKKLLIRFLNKIMNGESIKTLLYTDDTEMTLSIASSLVDKGEIDAKDIAERFTADYLNETINRGYGSHVRRVFYKLKETSYKDVFLPAKEQFNGGGSYGNGAAMRTAPIALFGNNKGEDYVVNAAKDCALITHAHRDGYRGAILQCLAVKAAFELDSAQEVDPIMFVSDLLEKMKHIETETIKPYCKSLEKMKDIFLQNRDDVSSEEIAECLGNGHDVSALKSVPTAIYSFLRGMKPIKNYFENSNPFMRTIYFAISVGGDTDTIGAMAGAIAGAYYGEDIIPEVVQNQCESIDKVKALADKLFDVTYKK